MEVRSIINLLDAYKAGDISKNEALSQLKMMPFEDLGYAKIDHHRALRNGFPEVIFGLGKTPEQIGEIFSKLAGKNNAVMCTKTDEAAYEAVSLVCPDACYHKASKLIILERGEPEEKRGNILVVAAGTADLPIAEEAAISAEVMGNKVTRLYDVGVAGIHRLLANYHYFNDAQVVIVVAGMEGALASVVGGLVEQPVIAVPTSIGYGAQFNGLAPLLCMLNSCATGVSVVNIDNGFGAATVANAIQLAIEKARRGGCVKSE
ncbi:MAG: nickel pincer cofactor biosynthesis protein LarB [Clostridia bacterium]|jgi:NCAIR mutase (PurE)-related protein|nr:nickel pincer cofactor biosynthesis protein LarB [Clostridia bacterium]